MVETKVITHGWGGHARARIFSGPMDRRFAMMAKTGIRPAEISWALEMSLDDVEARLEILSVRLSGDHGAPGAVSDKPRRILPDSPCAARPLLLDQAKGALGKRVALRKGEIHLDGNPLTFRALVMAAASLGVNIHYPGLRPLPAAFHTGPTRVGGGRCKPSKSSQISIQVPH